MTSCTWRTVLGPRSHRTRRIASSASVGRGEGNLDISASIYERLRSVNEDLRNKTKWDNRRFKGVQLTSGTYAKFDTTEGTFTVRLFEKEAPNTVANFVGLAEGS